MMRSDIGKQMSTPTNKITREARTGNVPKSNVMGSGKMNGGAAGQKGAMSHSEGCCARGSGHMGSNRRKD